MEHPEVAGRPCEECKRWMYDRDGKKTLRRGLPVLRPANVPTPCSSCPKKSPAEAPQYELSFKNSQAVNLYYQTRAMSAGNLTSRQRFDPLLAKNMALIDRIIRPIEAQQAALGQFMATRR